MAKQSGNFVIGDKDSAPVSPEQDPLTPPDWRWKRVMWSKQHNRGLTAGDDDFVRIAKRAHESFNTGRVKNADNFRLKFPGVYYAWKIWSSAGKTRTILDAYLCTGISTHEAGRKSGVKPETALMYAKLFFDVEDRLGNTGFMLEAIGEDTEPGSNAAFTKMLGWTKGVNMLDSYLLKDNPRRQKTNDVLTEAAEMVKHSLALTAAKVAQSWNPTPEETPEVLSAFYKNLQMDQAAGRRVDPTSANIKAAMRVLEGHVSLTNGAEPDKEMKMLKGGAELRLCERLNTPSDDIIDLSSDPDFRYPDKAAEEQKST